MENIFASSLFWPLLLIILIHLISFSVMAFVLRIFGHAKRKQFALLSTFSLITGQSATLLHKKGRRWIVLYFISTLFYAIVTLLFVLFQPTLL